MKREADRKFSYMDREGGEVSIFFKQWKRGTWALLFMSCDLFIQLFAGSKTFISKFGWSKEVKCGL